MNRSARHRCSDQYGEFSGVGARQDHRGEQQANIRKSGAYHCRDRVHA